ncbi:MAG TPA: phytanoyl-CoA dioxygenase family protein [Allosphingosinicella sp.]
MRRPMLSAEEVRFALASIAEMRPGDNFAPQATSWTYHCSFLDTDLAYRREAWGLGTKLFVRFVEESFHDYRIIQSNIYVKPPGTGQFGLHQNWPATADLNETTLTLWCPLVDVDEENGVVQFLPGSHKLLPHVQGPQSESFFEDLIPDLRPHLKWEPLPAGEGMIFDDALLHGSEPNRSATPRIAIQLILVPAESTPAFFYKVDDETFEIVRADWDFWLRHQHRDLLSRQPEWEHLAFVKSENRAVSLSEFEALLAAGAEIQWRGLSLERVSHAETGTAGGRGFLRRLLGRA